MKQLAPKTPALRPAVLCQAPVTNPVRHLSLHRPRGRDAMGKASPHSPNQSSRHCYTISHIKRLQTTTPHILAPEEADYSGCVPLCMSLLALVYKVTLATPLQDSRSPKCLSLKHASPSSKNSTQTNKQTID